MPLKKNSVHIEKMIPTDLPEVIVLIEQLGYPCTLKEAQSRFEVIESSQDYGLFVAKSENGKITGYIQINPEPHTLISGARADIGALVVDENMRNKGVGVALLKHAENWAQKNKLKLIRVRSNIKRGDAHRFYERNGYKINKTSHVLIKNLD